MKKPEPETSHLNVLIIEDSHEAGKYLKTALETMEMAFEITLLPSAEEALLALTDVKYDLLIVDIQLPGMNGIDLVKRIRKKDRATRVIMQTGIQDEQLINSLDTIQIDGFIQKPFKVGQIVDEVRKALNLQPPNDTQEIDVFPEVPEAKFRNPDLVENTLREMIQRLGAKEAIVVDSHGASLFRVILNGESDITDDMLPAFIKARSAVKELQQYVETDSPRNVFVLRGKSTDLLFATIFQYTLLLILNTGATALKVSLAFEELIRIQETFTHELYRQPFEDLEPVPQPGPVRHSEPAAKPVKKATQQERTSPPVDESVPIISDETFEKLLSSSLQPANLPNAGLDNFWESAADSRFEDFSGKNLTFEEAKKRGIAPSE
jgi:DNA-binding NarL/FixJ family response regulator